MGRLRFGLVLFLMLVPVSSSFASNYSYDYLGIALGRTNVDKPVVIGGYVFDQLGTLKLAGSYQFSDFLAGFIDIRSAGGESADGVTTLTGSDVAIGIKLINTVYNTDMNVGLALLSAKDEICIYSLCGTTDDSGARLMFEVRHSVTESTELNLLFERDSYDVDSYTTIGFGTAFHLTAHSSLRFNYEENSDSDTVATIGYLYSYGSNW